MMKHSMVTLLAIAVSCVPVFAVHAGELEVTVEIPRLNVSEYHRPYIAIWIQDKDRKVVSNLAVWYQLKPGQEGEGTKWLPDLRQWWRRSGRSLDLPIDGVSGATRPVGKHHLSFSDQQSGLSKLPPGEYTLIVEAAREVGGRELIEIPFTWPVDKPRTYEAQGSKELGKIHSTIKP